MKRTWLALALCLLCHAPAAALAQTDPRADASAHFERGTDLFNEGRYDAALAEFERAYEIAPALPVLYNLGRVHAELGHPVASAHAFERYLSEGGDTLPRARRTEVEQALARQRDRIGHLRVEANVEGAIVSVDGSDVATTPLASPIEVGSGTHSVGVRAPGYEGVTRDVSIAGTVEASVVVELRREIEPRGTLRISSTLAGVAVQIDGREVGITPLAATLPVPAGDHDVAGERAGYLGDSRRVHVDEGADVDVALRLSLDPSAPAETIGEVHLALPEAPFVVRIDDEAMIGRELQLRIGPHRIAIELAERQPWSGELTVTHSAALALAPPLVWTPEERAERTGAADTQRAAGIGLSFAGAALLLVGAPLLIWNELQISSTDTRVTQLNAEYAAMCVPYVPSLCDPLRAEGDSLSASRGTQDTLRWVSISATLLGAALGGVGLTLWATTPSNEDIDAAAHASLRLTPAGMELAGTF
jgi:hypothetical protein